VTWDYVVVLGILVMGALLVLNAACAVRETRRLRKVRAPVTNRVLLSELSAREAGRENRLNAEAKTPTQSFLPTELIVALYEYKGEELNATKQTGAPTAELDQYFTQLASVSMASNSSRFVRTATEN
jgi:hypothetical protein